MSKTSTKRPPSKAASPRRKTSSPPFAGQRPLDGRVAVVAGATRGAGRAIARVLGEAGAIVYCSGRGSRAQPSSTGYYAGRPETIDETAELVGAAGGIGIPVRVDHSNEADVASLFSRVQRDHKRLDILVNSFWGGPAVTHWGSFWKQPLGEVRGLFDAAWPHVITCRYGAALMVEQRSGLVVQLTEGDALYYRHNLFYDLGRISEIRLAYAVAEELGPHGITALALTPGFMRTEDMLDHFGVTEANWRDGGKKDPNFLASETPFFVARAVLALATDPDVARKAGGLYSSWDLSDEYGFTDVDGSRPHLGRNNVDIAGGAPRSGRRWEVKAV
jgi:NAD(P)-dependent dehydrogenase (short-subunit alcohol dehydrogenase family)